MRQIIFLVFLSLVFSVSAQNPGRQSSVEKDKKNNFTDYTYKIIPSINNTWCYDIYKNSKMLIHQTNIPGLPGNEGFKKKSDAEKVARLVIKKLENGEMPPSVTVDEMNKLKVL
jgi:hypothetical protein